jgi:DNA-binding response OmpR family regulator
MSLGLIKYIEDSEAQRKSLKMALEHRNFRVETAGDVTDARKLIEELREHIDVIVLDMRLEDPKCPQMTGADIAIEYFNPQTPYPPEFMIHSAHSEVDYYKLALKLGVATYLQKSEYDQVDLIRHIRALTIRRLLSIKRPDAADRIQRIVESSRNRSEAIVKFCRDELEPDFSGRLGAPFIFLFTEDDHTSCCAGNVDLPESLDLYETIQAMVFAEVRSGNPFIVDAGKIPDPLDPKEMEVLKRLDGAAFIPLTIDRDARLSIGLLTADPNYSPLPEPPAEMASVLAKYLESAVIELLLTVLIKWTEHHTKNETKRKELMRITSEVCLSVGRQQLSILQQLNHPIPVPSEDKCLRLLHSLAENLQATGTMLESLAKPQARIEERWLPTERVSMKQFIKSVWTYLDYGENALSIHGDCEVQATSEDLSVTVSSVLQWFAQRFSDTPQEIKPHISVNCGYSDKGAELIFEDRSERLDKMLRRHLFDPFAETVTKLADNDDAKVRVGLYWSLFWAKVLVEARYKGRLEDISDGIAGAGFEAGEAIGHRFRMYFPLLHHG